jgi:ribonuclease III
MLCYDGEVTRDEIEGLLDMRVRNVAYYQQALLHKSAVKIYNASQSYERLEFIGDSVLNLIVAKDLFDKYPNEDEGFMTKLRTRIVSGKCLASIAGKMGLQNHIRMNEKAMRQKWNENKRILEDTLEALIGAIYLDMGLYYARSFVSRQLELHVNEEYVMMDTNYKDMLMRYTQTNGVELPVYQLYEEDGPNHNKMFVMNVYINGNLLGEGRANNKKQAEQNAAMKALQCLGELSV